MKIEKRWEVQNDIEQKEWVWKKGQKGNLMRRGVDERFLFLF